MLNLTVLLNSKFARQFSSETILLSTLVDNHNELSLRSIGTLRPLHMSPVSRSRLNSRDESGMNSGGPDGIVLHCLPYFPHYKHPI